MVSYSDDAQAVGRRADQHIASLYTELDRAHGHIAHLSAQLADATHAAEMDALIIKGLAKHPATNPPISSDHPSIAAGRVLT